jgi:hypothetical protein
VTDAAVPVRRYLLFAGLDYGRQGGWLDLVGSYDAPAEAVAEAERRHQAPGDGLPDVPWYHVVDIQTGEIIAWKEW